MSNYTITTDFGAKDSLPSGNAAKVIKGSEFTAEFTNIQTAIATKLDLTNGSATNLTTTGTLTNSGAMTTTGVSTFNGAVNFASTTAHAGNATFSDNAKAIFGAGADLQIYHDGTDTHIVESGAGSLKIKGNFLQLLSPDNEKFFEGQANGASSLFYNGVARLDTTSTGIHVQASSSGATGVADGTLIVEQGSAPSIQILSANTQTQSIKFGDPQDGDVGKINYSHADNHMALFTDGTEAIHIDSSQNVGIGTTNLTRKFRVVDATDASADFRTTDGTDRSFEIDVTSSASEVTIGTATSHALAIKTDDTARMRIDSSGNVGIGTDSPTEKLDIDGDSIRLRQSQTPASASATGSQGQIAWDANYMYVCTATDTWKRVALATW
jgi:hypothetical protein